MNAKEYLSQALNIDRGINSKLEQVASLQELAAKATTYDTTFQNHTKIRSFIPE